ncbi:tyrosine-type recombinase/integrase [Paraburkholderia hayleyella]|uniref:tyrosine-type recombinase/integrase n=1 Tax=Paraburkholderia hayleyella TaxID=2152889 RepID=UPI001FEAB4B8|nr:tyrosine-type recombinase/integrase [Paraburkholderia hayleyella]
MSNPPVTPNASIAALTPIAPVELLILPERLDGRDGANRADDAHSQLSAQNDLDAVRAWLANYAETKTTFDNYRKEAERLLLWAVAHMEKPLSSLTHEDLLRYRAFLADPQPAARWVSSTGGKYPRGDARWRPFNGPLAVASQRQALIILNAMFAWLVHAGYLRGNPMALLRQRTQRSAPRITRYLSTSLWDEVKCFIAQLPEASERERAYAARSRWLATLFYLQGMRISEVANGQMGHFMRRLGADGQHQWWLETLGKGSKVRIVPASAELIAEMSRYRLAHGLSALPTRAEETPLILPLSGAMRCLSRSAVHDAIKRIFADAAGSLRSRGLAFADRADELEQASAHWLRHTAGSHMADGGVDLRTVRDNLGHVSLNTTSLYLHAEDDERHRETVQRHRMGWNALPDTSDTPGPPNDEPGDTPDTA